ncbi:MAG: hypothetical protein OFPI_34600 [Osedax symbiont Rs2]|nr:MAG: hypothetical protein OFPI_34600 [Osedax symbiont Rs2]
MFFEPQQSKALLLTNNCLFYVRNRAILSAKATFLRFL